MRVLALGSACDASVAALRAMLTAGVPLVGLVMPQPATADIVGVDRSSSVESLAGEFDVPLAAVSRGNAETITALRRFRPDVVVAACFPWRLSAAALAIPPLGCLNIHPSLLPRGRGPDPVFWTYRRGERDTGVTVHLMDAGFDTGPILGQRRSAVPVGSRAPELERGLMAAGGELTAELLPTFAEGTVLPVPQDDAVATNAPMPTAEDYTISTVMPPTWAYSFARGVAPWHGPLSVQIAPEAERLPVRDAVDYAEDDHIAGAVIDEGRGLVRVRLGGGWVRFIRAEVGRYPLSLSPIRARDIR